MSQITAVQAAILAIVRAPVPVVALISGSAAGFGVEDRVIVDDEPMASLYTDVPERKRTSNVIKL